MAVYNSSAILEDFKWERRFPAIHDDMMHVVSAHVTGRRFLDLGAGFGLLSERVRRNVTGAFVCGVEPSKRVVDAGVNVGIGQEAARGRQVLARVGRGELPWLRRFISEMGLTVVLARRVIPELFTRSTGWEAAFVECLLAGGITEIVVEGRVDSARSTHHLRNLDAEVRLLTADDHYRERARYRNVAYLRSDSCTRLSA